MHMNKRGFGPFPYFVGVRSLADIAARHDRVCVVNILGTESRDVTPTSHAYSGANVLFGTQPGRRGQVLETPAGAIPVFNNVREGLDAGLSFDTGVVYLPPAGVRDAVAELARVNPALRKVVIVTEKVPVRAAREIRAIAQQYGIDVFGANCLGVADAWNHVRIGGALGGDTPEESLKKGSVAIYSNSGNFTTTIANYLRAEGWGTTTLISSGKDVYIHFAMPEFAYCFDSDHRSKAAVLYVEPGGYYEQSVEFSKPVVACIVGRWKSRLTRAVGHAGALAGSGDDAAAKEAWFLERFGVDQVFTPETMACSAKGAVVTNISHVPAALTAVMRLNGIDRDFQAEGNLSLKPWFGNDQSLDPPPHLSLPVVRALAPYAGQIEALNRQIGATFPRQNMKDASGASQMDDKTQVTRLHGVPVLDAARRPFAANLGLAVLREMPGAAAAAMIEVAVAAEINLHGDAILAAAQAAREAGNSPNTILAAAASLVGPHRVGAARQAVAGLIDTFIAAGLDSPWDSAFDGTRMVWNGPLPLTSPAIDVKAARMLAAFDRRQVRSVFIDFLRRLGGHPTADAVLAAIAVTVGWEALRKKRITRLNLLNLPWHLRLAGILMGAAAPARFHGVDSFAGVPLDDIVGAWPLSAVAHLALTGQLAELPACRSLDILMGLLISNGPGTISAQGAKGAVSADGPEHPDRVQINKAMVGMLTHTGFSHGGNGFEGIRFLLDRFAGQAIADPGAADHGIDLDGLAATFAQQFKARKADQKAAGGGDTPKIPCINHPVFKGQAVNIDPREAFVAALLAENGEYNIFHDFYRRLVRALKDAGVSRDVHCVNVDAVIACILLKLLWAPYQQGALGEADLEAAAFTVFLFGRIAGTMAEVDDHTNRGKDMDTRTPATQCRFVS